MGYYGRDYFGGDQKSFYKKLTKKFKSKDLKIELSNLIDIIHKYKPEYTDKDIMNLARDIKEGGCSYVSTANMIFEQLGYDEKLFYSLFGFNMKNASGLNHDALIVDLYTFMLDKCRVEVSGYFEEKYFDDIHEAAKELLNKEYQSDDKLSASGKAMLDLVNAGYTVDGNKYTRFVKKPKTYIGDYKKIAKEIDPTLSINTIEEFRNALKKSHISAGITGYDQADKLTGSLAPDAHLNLWLNYYFKEKRIDLEVNTKQISNDNMFNDINDALSNKGTISVSLMASSKIWMHNGKRAGWFNFTDAREVGHVMTFRGFTENGDIKVSSWGEFYVIPKEYASELLMYQNKLIPRKKEEKQSISEANQIVDNNSNYNYDIHNTFYELEDVIPKR